MGLIVWIIIIIVIVTNIKKKKEMDADFKTRKDASLFDRPYSEDRNKLREQEMRKQALREKYASSYYANGKREQYQKMNEEHATHKDEVDLSDKIGYIKCPNCGGTVSKTSDTCFLCDAILKENAVNEKKNDE